MPDDEDSDDDVKDAVPLKERLRALLAKKNAEEAKDKDEEEDDEEQRAWTIHNKTNELMMSTESDQVLIDHFQQHKIDATQTHLETAILCSRAELVEYLVMNGAPTVNVYGKTASSLIAQIVCPTRSSDLSNSINKDAFVARLLRMAPVLFSAENVALLNTSVYNKLRCEINAGLGALNSRELWTILLDNKLCIESADVDSFVQSVTYYGCLRLLQVLDEEVFDESMSVCIDCSEDDMIKTQQVIKERNLPLQVVLD